MNALEQNIRVAPDTLANLMVAVEKGQYRVPQFQRDYVWEVSKVRALFDSIYREYPIGSFFIWKADRQHNQLFRHSPGLDLQDVKADDDVSFILDGQQRITSLYVTLKGLSRLGTDYGRVCIDLKDEKFVHRDPDGRRFISVSHIWGPDGGRIYSQIDEQYFHSFDRCYRILRTYPVSIVEVRDKGLDAVCRIFQRINQGGKRLDRFDLIAAMTFDPEFDLRERVDRDIIRPLRDKGFGKVPRAVVTQLIALKVKGACTETAQYGLTREDIRGNWKNVIDSIMLAIDFLKSNCFVLRLDFLPYNSIITLASYYFLKSGKRSIAPEHSEWMKHWFWRSAFGKRYGGGGETRVAQDSKLIDQLIAGGSPGFEIPHAINADELIRTKMTWTGSAVRCGFLCLLASRHPKNLESNAELSLISGSISEFTSAEKHHIFPQAFLQINGAAGNVHSLPNFCFIPAELNKKISDKRPSEYFAELARHNDRLDDALASHLIPALGGSGIPGDDYLRFLRNRARTILAAIEHVCGWAQRPAESERFPAVKFAEGRLRDFIDYVLTESHGEDCWKRVVPQDVREYVIRVAKPAPGQDLKSHARPSIREQLNSCTIGHYKLIITATLNWPYFKPYLHKQGDVERYLTDFADYRNCVAHDKELSQLVQMQGEAALTWMADAIPSLSDLRGDEHEEGSEDQQLPGEGEEFAGDWDNHLAVVDDDAVPLQSTPKPPKSSQKTWSENSFFERIQHELRPDEVSAMHKVYDWAQENALRVDWGTGKTGSFNPKFPSICSGSLMTVYANGDVVMNFGNTIASGLASDTWDRLADVLEESGFLPPRLERPGKYPSVRISSLVDRVEQFLDILEQELAIGR